MSVNPRPIRRRRRDDERWTTVYEPGPGASFLSRVLRAMTSIFGWWW